MSGRLCCYKQQQCSKLLLLSQFVFKLSAFHFNTHTKTRAPLPDCRVNNALIQFVLVSKAGKFSDIAAALSQLNRENFKPKNSISK